MTKKNKDKFDGFPIKWIVDGCKNFDEMIKVFEIKIEYFKKLKELGCKIEEAVDNGHVFYLIPNKKIADYCKEFEIEEEDLETEGEEE